METKLACTLARIHGRSGLHVADGMLLCQLDLLKLIQHLQIAFAKVLFVMAKKASNAIPTPKLQVVNQLFLEI